MASKVTALHQARRPRDSSDDFGAGSLGSIGGSEVGSSVEAPAAAVGTSASPLKPTSSLTKTKPIETIEVKKEPLLTAETTKLLKAPPIEADSKPTARKAEATREAKPQAEGAAASIKNPPNHVVDKKKTSVESPSTNEQEKKPAKITTDTKPTTTNNPKHTSISPKDNQTLLKPPPSTTSSEPPSKESTSSTLQKDTTTPSSPIRSNPSTKLSSSSSSKGSPSKTTSSSPIIRRSPRRKQHQGSLDLTLTSEDDSKILPSTIPSIGSASFSADVRILPGPAVDPLPSIHAALSSKNSSKILPTVSASLSGRTKTIVPTTTTTSMNTATTATATTARILPTSDALPAMDTSSVDSSAHGSGTSKMILPHIDALPSMDALPNIMDVHQSSSPLRMRSESISSQGRSLDLLDALGHEAKEAAAKFKLRKRSLSGENSNDTSSHGTLTSQNHRYLVEALMDDGSKSAADHPQPRDRLDSITSRKDRLNSFDMDFEEERLSTFHQDLRRERLNSLDLDATAKRERLNSLDIDFSLRRERLNSLEMDFSSRRERLNSLEMDFSSRRDRKGSSDISPRRDRLNSFDSQGRAEMRERRGRDRCESWGGMSDLSIPLHEPAVGDSLVGGGTATAAQLAATIYTSLANDLTAAANPDDNESISSFLVPEEKIPSKISVQRDRLNSIATMGSSADASAIVANALGQSATDIGAFVKNAMESMGDTLAEIANAATEAAKEPDLNSHASSSLSPMIGATSDHGSKVASTGGAQPASSALSVNLDISVDYDAVAAAVDAAQAAAGAIDLATFAGPSDPIIPTAAPSAPSKKKRKAQAMVESLRAAEDGSQSTTEGNKATSKASRADLPPIPESKMDEKELAIIRERARAAAGYVPPTKNLDSSPAPPRKKVKMDPETPGQPTTDAYQTPKVSNASKTAGERTDASVLNTPASSIKTPASKGQSSQKWDSMFECLVKFIEERRIGETADMSEEEKKDWVWDGNVPTTFKTTDGKALGRWVNNQRSAKSKGVLKDDREKRLVEAGLKWSVLASNSWNEMLEELRIYVADQTKAGRKWDGNVPTNYRIKTKLASGSKDDEDKNLGRWVNRQRSLYSAGKLRKDRQKALEDVGLKWSMLATTSWESMFETLCEYVESKTKGGADWDGNVPANYKTNDSPPRALGRWINRQRSAYGKDKLKPDCVAKLNKIGLKWSVHERRPTSVTPNETVSSSAANAAPSESANASTAVAPPAAVASSAAGAQASASTSATAPAAAPKPPPAAKPPASAPAPPPPPVAAAPTAPPNPAPPPVAPASAARPPAAPASAAPTPAARPSVAPAPAAAQASSAPAPAARPPLAPTARAPAAPPTTANTTVNALVKPALKHDASKAKEQAPPESSSKPEPESKQKEEQQGKMGDKEQRKNDGNAPKQDVKEAKKEEAVAKPQPKKETIQEKDKKDAKPDTVDSDSKANKVTG